MAIVSEPNEYSVEGIVETDEGNRRVVFTQGINGTQQNYSEMSVECIVEDDSGNKQRCVAVKNFGGGGGGGGTDDYSDLTNKPKINNVTLSGNKTGSDLGLVNDVQINGTSIKSSGVANISLAGSSTLGVIKVGTNYGTAVTGEGLIYVVRADSSDINSKSNNYKPIVPSTLDYAVRSVRPAYTEIPASSATYTLSSNATFGQTPSQAVTYTLPTVIAGVDNWCKLFVDCTTTASIAFTTTDSTTITPVGSPTITQGNSYIFVCQYDNLAETWKVFLVDATV